MRITKKVAADFVAGDIVLIGYKLYMVSETEHGLVLRGDEGEKDKPVKIFGQAWAKATYTVIVDDCIERVKVEAQALSKFIDELFPFKAKSK